MAESTGIGKDGGVQARGGPRRDLELPRLQEVVNELARRGGIGEDQVDGAELGVGDVVVDIDDHRRLRHHRLVRAGARRVASVEDEDRGLRRRGLPVDTIDAGQEPPGARDRRRGEHGHGFSDRLERQRERERGSERVAIRILMRDGRDHRSVVDHLPDPGCQRSHLGARWSEFRCRRLAPLARLPAGAG